MPQNNSDSETVDRYAYKIVERIVNTITYEFDLSRFTLVLKF
jgi:hypothetical protein